MRWFNQLRAKFGRRVPSNRLNSKARFRRLIMEQFEERRVLAAAVDDSYSMESNTTLTVDGYGTWANDSYNSSWSEPSCLEGEWQEGEWVCLIEGSTTSYANSSIVSGPSHGTLTLIDTGAYYYDGYGNIAGQYGLAFTYTPNTDFGGIDTFSYQISDDNGSSTAWVSIQVIAPPTPPVANDDEYTTDEDEAIVVSILANDTDANSDPLTASIVSGPSHGSLAFGEGGSLTYTPAANYLGEDFFTYVANDGLYNSNTATVALTITPIADAPTVSHDYYTTLPNSTLNVDSTTGVLADDFDADGDTLTASVVSPPANGSLTLNTDGSFTYVPAANFNGLDSFYYAASDGTHSVTAVALISVGNAPVAVADSYTTAEDTPLIVSSALTGVLGNDTDADGDALSISVLGQPEHGSVTMNSDGTFTYTPDGNFSGTDSFIYGAIDPSLLVSNNATVTLTVTDVNDAPVLLGGRDFPAIDEDPFSLSNVGQSVLFFVADLVTDVDNGALGGIAVTAVNNTNGTWQYSLDGGESWNSFGLLSATSARLLASGQGERLRFVPNINFNGTVSAGLTYRAWDRTTGTNGGTANVTTNGGTTAFSEATAAIGITINPVNDAPVLLVGREFPSINEDPISSENVGESVPYFVTNVIDGDSGALGGMAVTGVNNAYGNWQYSLNGGVSWTDFGSPSATSARLLASGQDQRLRFVPIYANFNGHIAAGLTYRAWDQTTGTNGGTADVSTNGGATAFSAAIKTVGITVNPVNDAPSFAKGANLTVTDEDTLQVVNGWATNLSVGPGNETGQALDFDGLVTVPAEQQYLFKVLPTIDATGELTFESAANVAGTATVTVRIHDDGGTDNGGVDTSAAQTFTITITKPTRWYNAEGKDDIGFRHLDVDNDGTIELQDARTVIAFLDTNSFTEIEPTDPIGADFQGRSPLFLDVSGDNYVSTIDALLIINYINSNLTSPWHNTTNPLDVNASGSVTTLDAVLISNYLNSANPVEVPEEEESGPPFIDVNGDWQVTQADLIVVMNHLNNSPHYWHNSISGLSQDVNADGEIDSADYYVLQDYLNCFGPGAVPADNGDPVFFYFDVNADDYVDEDDLELLEDLI
jgi:VCBS repeat-containing protein